MTERGKRSKPARVAAVIVSISLWSVIILARLWQLQVLQHSEFAQQALKQQLVASSVPAPRLSLGIPARSEPFC